MKLKIKAYLMEEGFTVASIEKRLGLGRNTLQQSLDRGSLRYDMAERIAHAIGKKIRWLDE